MAVSSLSLAPLLELDDVEPLGLTVLLLYVHRRCLYSVRVFWRALPRRESRLHSEDLHEWVEAWQSPICERILNELLRRIRHCLRHLTAL